MVIAVAIIAMYLSLQLAFAVDMAKQHTQDKIAHGEEVSNAEMQNGFSFGEVLSGFNDRITNEPSKIEITPSANKISGLTALILFCWIAWYFTGQRKLINGKEYGSADWGTAQKIAHLQGGYLYNREVKKINKNKDLNKPQKEAKIEELKIRYGKDEKKKYYYSDRLFTKTEKICMHNFELNNNTLIIGGSGSGKSRGYVLPNLLQANSSVIITDPKGELVGKVGYFLTKIAGYKLRILELGDYKERSDSFNPLYYIHPERADWEERVLSLIDALIANTDGGEEQKGSDPFWGKAERLFLQAIIFAVVTAFKPEEQNFNTCVELIHWLEIEEERDDKNSRLDAFFRKFKERYGENHIAVHQFDEFRSKASGKTAKSIVISAVARLAPMKIPVIQRILGRDDMQLDMVGEEKTAIFVVKPPTVHSCDFIAGMFFTILFQELNYCATIKYKKEQRLPVPVHFYLDEYANTCRIGGMVEIISYARSLGVGITIVLQSRQQIEDIHEKQWQTIVDTTNTFLYLGGIRSPETLEWISKLLGKGTFEKKSTSRTRGRQGSSSTSFDKIGRELLDAAEIQKLKKDKCLFFISGYDPYMSIKYKYESHPNYKYTSDANKEYFFEYVPRYLTERKVQGTEQEKAEVDEQAKREEWLEREIDSIVYSNLPSIDTDVDIETEVQKLKANLPRLTIIADAFEGEVKAIEETLEDRNSEVLNDILNDAASAARKEKEDSDDINSAIADIMYANIMAIDTQPEKAAETIIALAENKNNIVDYADSIKLDEIKELIERENPHGEEDEEYADEDESDIEILVRERTNFGTDLTESIKAYQDERSAG